MPYTSITEKDQTRTYVTLTSKRDAAGKPAPHSLTVHGMIPEDFFKLIQKAILDEERPADP